MVKKTKKQLKEMNKNLVRTMTHGEYKNMLFEKNQMRRRMRRMQCKFHKLRKFKVGTIYLLCFDDQHYMIHNNSIRT